jgi:chromosome segregation ATPase
MESRLSWTQTELTNSRSALSSAFNQLSNDRQSLLNNEASLTQINPVIAQLELDLGAAQAAVDEFFAENLEPVEQKLAINSTKRSAEVQVKEEFLTLAADLEESNELIGASEGTLNGLLLRMPILSAQVEQQELAVDASRTDYKAKKATFEGYTAEYAQLKDDLVVKKAEIKELEKENDRLLSELR